jgi:hypothetical protein
MISLNACSKKSRRELHTHTHCVDVRVLLSPKHRLEQHIRGLANFLIEMWLHKQRQTYIQCFLWTAFNNIIFKKLCWEISWKLSFLDFPLRRFQIAFMHTIFKFGKKLAQDNSLLDKSTRYYIPEGCHLHTHCSENPKSKILDQFHTQS